MSKSASTWSAQAIERLERLIRGARREVDVKSKFKVGDIVKIAGVFAEVVPLNGISGFRNLVRIQLIPGGEEQIVAEELLNATNLKVGDSRAGVQETYKSPKGMENSIGEPRGWSWAEAQMNKMKNDEGIRESWTGYTYGSAGEVMEFYDRCLRQGKKPSEMRTSPTQTIFRLKRKDGAKGFTGCYFVKVAEDSTEILVKQVGLSTAKVEDWVTNISKDEWDVAYNVGDEIINFLRARGGNFQNKD